MEAPKFNQWKNSASMIELFKAIEKKQHHSFICSDIVEFYPSISQDLLNIALGFVSDTPTLSQKGIETDIPDPLYF